MMVDVLDLLVCRATMLGSDSRVEGRVRPSKCCRASGVWLRKGSANCETITKSSNIIVVSLIDYHTKRLRNANTRSFRFRRGEIRSFDEPKHNE